MSLFGKNHRNKYSYDPEKEYPVIRASICTGEQVAGFKDRTTGEFHDVKLIRSEADKLAFMKEYHLDDIAKEY
ncbi:MAG: aspartate dehydrogenase [Lachnospiraceae bacterium]|nr:aspartate dehydrogenase [Lachnospiraceae bacterium]